MNKIIKDLEEGIITLETIISNVICMKCSETLPDHSVLEHFDEQFMTNLHTCGDAVTDTPAKWLGDYDSIVILQSALSTVIMKQVADDVIFVRSEPFGSTWVEYSIKEAIEKIKELEGEGFVNQNKI